MSAEDVSVEFLALAMERLTAVEKRADAIAALEARVAASEAALAAYKAAMPQPQAYYVVLEQLPWASAGERAERLLEARRSVLGAVAAVTRPALLSEVGVRCFLGRSRGTHVAIVLITCGTCGPTHDPGDLHTALSGCGVRVKQWHTIMSRIEQTHFEVAVADDVVFLPVSANAEPNEFAARISTPDAEVGYGRLHVHRARPDPEEAERAEEWVRVTNFDLFVHDKPRGDLDATGQQ